MSNKAVSKFWIEIIGGVIIVVIVLLVFLTISSAVSTGVEDASNKQAFIHFTQLISKANMEGEDTVAPFSIKTSDNHREYAILFMPPSTADCLYTYSANKSASDEDLDTCMKDSSTSIPIRPSVTLDRVSMMKIKKCTSKSLQDEDMPNDICLCMIRIDSRKYEPYTNLVGEEVIPYERDNPDAAFKDITNWGRYVFEGVILDSHTSANLKVLSCSLMIGDIGCSVKYKNREYPCAVAVAKNENPISPSSVEQWFSSPGPLLMYWLGGTGTRNVKMESMTANYNGKGLIIIYPYTLGGKFLYEDDRIDKCINGCIPIPVD